MGDTPLPSFLSEGFPLRTGTSSEGNPEFWRLQGLWPGADAMLPLSPVTDPTAATRQAMSMVSPLIQEPIEQATNQDWYRSLPGKSVPIEDTPGEVGSFLGLNMPQRAIHALSNLRPLTEVNRLNPFDVFGTDTRPSPFGAVREFPDPDASQRWTNLLYGRGYAIDPQRNARDHQRALMRAVRSLEWNISMAERDGKTAKADQARRQLEYLYNHPESITPDMAK